MSSSKFCCNYVEVTLHKFYFAIRIFILALTKVLNLPDAIILPYLGLGLEAMVKAKIKYNKPVVGRAKYRAGWYESRRVRAHPQLLPFPVVGDEC